MVLLTEAFPFKTLKCLLCAALLYYLNNLAILSVLMKHLFLTQVGQFSLFIQSHGYLKVYNKLSMLNDLIVF